MARKLARKKTKAELESRAFLDRTKRQNAVLLESYNACDKLSKKRHQFIFNEWVYRLEDIEDDVAFNREGRKWKKLRAEFLNEATKPLELHCFTCNWNADSGLKPLAKIIKSDHCDAGTALRLYWVMDPYYYQEYATIGECYDEEERESLRLLRAIERRFKAANFATKRIPFDPTPWVANKTVKVPRTPFLMRCTNRSKLDPRNGNRQRFANWIPFGVFPGSLTQ